MLVITLPDNSTRQFDHSVSVLEVAQSIGAGLAQATLAGLVDDHLVDVDYMIEADHCLRLITNRDPEGLEIIRHSCAHLMAQAVKALYPQAQVTIGPVIEDGFYYDYSYPHPFTEEDMQAIEDKMYELAKADYQVKRSEMSRIEAVQFFRDQGEIYKAEIIESIPENETLSLYHQGEFTDLCRGPHVPSTKHLKAFKLLKLAGAYWRGDSKQEMLQRVYGTAWADKKSLKQYLHRLAEAEKRDHRKLAKKLDLFHMQEEAPGMVFWHPKGWVLYQVIKNHIRQKMQASGYQEIHTPIMIDKVLWERSGHWDKFREDMFTTSSENREYAIKPMNCPAHIQIFNQGLKSYRDLPLRLAEFGCCHRNEASGALHGLMRARNFVQDDAHIFCTEDQIQEEVSNFIDLLYDIYADFGFNEILIQLSTRPENRVGSDEIWDKAEKALELALNNKRLAWKVQVGEGAFYGPKIEFSLKDCIGRIWQCGTIQVDFSMPKSLDAYYIDEQSQKQTPVMLHRAVVGSMERFIGILIEQYADALPLWLAPVQMVIMTITEKQVQYADKIASDLNARGFRVNTDLRNETISLKIREHSMNRVPYQVIIGEQEVSQEMISVRTHSGQDLGKLSIEDFNNKLNDDIKHLART